jgi:hypothetical protein
LFFVVYTYSHLCFLLFISSCTSELQIKRQGIIHINFLCRRRNSVFTNILVVFTVLNMKVRKRNIRKRYAILAKEPLDD